jgi:hypothetical protein
LVSESWKVLAQKRCWLSFVRETVGWGDLDEVRKIRNFGFFPRRTEFGVEAWKVQRGKCVRSPAFDGCQRIQLGEGRSDGEAARVTSILVPDGDELSGTRELDC